MGGFASSKHMSEYLHNDRAWDREWIPDEAYEHIEQCIEMTKVFETGDYDKFLDFSKAFMGKYPAVERMLQHSNFSSEKEQ